jgi:transcriptional regulator with PAS, ATPase and Fis domain
MHLLYNKGVFKDVSGKVAGIVGAILDITERKNIRLELEKAKEFAELSVSLLKEIPAGIVMVDEDLKIIDCNEGFASIAGEDIKDLFEFNPGLKGADITKIVEFHKYFSSIFQNGGNIVGKDIKIENKIYEVSFYAIKDQKVIGAILLDMSNPSLRNEEVIERTEEVIKRNLDTVHKIAYLLGENAARTEDMLGSIIEIYKSGK